MILSDLIRTAISQDSIVSVYVYGNLGVGKTSYALWVAYEVLGSWDGVLRYLFFRPEDAVRAIASAVNRGVKLPIIIMDDAGTWLNRLTWWERGKISFMNFFNLIRSVAHSIIFTTPSEELPKQILRKTFIRVNVRRASYEEINSRSNPEQLTKIVEEYGIKPVFSIAVGYIIKTLPSFTQIVRKDFYDIFPTFYPNHVFEKYEKMRYNAVRLLLNEWMASTRSEIVEQASEMISKGLPVSEVVRYMMVRGISRTTAYRLVKRLVESKQHLPNVEHLNT